MNVKEKGSGFEVRSAAESEARALSILAAKMVRMHHELDGKRFIKRENIEEGYERWLIHEIKNPQAVVLAAVTTGGSPLPPSAVVGGEEVIGYAYGNLVERDWMVLRDPCGMLHDLYVEAEHRKLGVGKALVEMMTAKLIELGAPRVALHTAWRNESARRFFESLGFRSTMLEMMREADRTA